MKKTVDQTAHELVRGERAKTYGPPHVNFEVIANLWNAYLRPTVQAMVERGIEAGKNDEEEVYVGRIVDENDVCNLMTLLKMAREASGQGYHADSTVDAIGYQIIKEVLNVPLDEFIKEMKS